MFDDIVIERGLSRAEAYVFCSVCVDLKISRIVDAPNWIMSAFLPNIVFSWISLTLSANALNNLADARKSNISRQNV